MCLVLFQFDLMQFETNRIGIAATPTTRRRSCGNHCIGVIRAPMVKVNQYLIFEEDT